MRVWPMWFGHGQVSAYDLITLVLLNTTYPYLVPIFLDSIC